jgi:hypothetical protein
MSDVTSRSVSYAILQCEKCEQFYSFTAGSKAELQEWEAAFVCECTSEEAVEGRRRSAELVEQLRDLLDW